MQETPEPAKAAPAPDSSREHHSFFGLWFWALLLLLVIYPLSLGPAARIAQDYPNTRPVLTVIYTPMQFLVYIAPPLERFLDWYLSIWTGQYSVS